MLQLRDYRQVSVDDTKYKISTLLLEIAQHVKDASALARGALSFSQKRKGGRVQCRASSKYTY